MCAVSGSQRSDFVARTVEAVEDASEVFKSPSLPFQKR